MTIVNNGKNRKDQVISLRLSDRVLQRIQNAIGKSGESVGDFLRGSAMKELERRERQ